MVNATNPCTVFGAISVTVLALVISLRLLHVLMSSVYNHRPVCASDLERLKFGCIMGCM